MKILVISSANMDLVMKMDAVPDPGQTVIDHDTYKYVPGGKGANSSLAFRRLGAETVFCARLGDDQNGRSLKDLYDQSGIDTSKIVTDPDLPTGLAAIMLEGDGINRIVVYPGANYAMTEADVDRAFECSPDAVFMQLEIPAKIVTYAAFKANALNIPTVIDAGPADKAFPLKELKHLTVFSPNETEAEIFTGISPDCEENCLKAARKLEESVDADHYVIKLGGRGAYLYSGGRGNIIPPYKTDVKDTTAAGDAFTAALTLEYLKTKDIMSAVMYANAVGAITVSRFGASTSIPTAKEVEDFFLQAKKQ